MWEKNVSAIRPTLTFSALYGQQHHVSSKSIGRSALSRIKGVGIPEESRRFWRPGRGSRFFLFQELSLSVFHSLKQCNNVEIYFRSM
ncbi:hypothetical protein VIGAN_07115800 [Vigna angularis var. angularis]|uniref:Uncharacterized protein n=1 Tax=Vigna angularis var. angularis TaxID=157739 RepID=A0A0S3SHX3_PHAAN|nr:hypothetical protein VIGAN_07115800 [Vigna angularis var. angularis]